MRIFIPDMAAFFSWMDQSGYRYVVLRNAPAFLNGYPAPGSKDDVDMLVDDAALAPIRARYGRYRKRQGVKCDVYDVSGTAEGAYTGQAYYPRPLAEWMLGEREMFHDRFYVARPRPYLFGLMYHISYQKAERSKIDRRDESLSLDSKYVPELRDLMARAGVSIPLTLAAFDAALRAEGLGPTYRQLEGILANDFSRGIKGRHLAEVCDVPAGEMNLFVIREVVARRGLVEDVSRRIHEAYVVLAEKDISWLTHLRTGKQMRGGKWRRGGRPVKAMVVFDPEPVATTDEDRAVHPFVFNARQFMKRDLRAWFAETTGLDPWHNPLHSTDNEAEALGHLALYFTPEEREAIYARLDVLRTPAAGEA